MGVSKCQFEGEHRCVTHERSEISFSLKKEAKLSELLIAHNLR